MSPEQLANEQKDAKNNSTTKPDPETLNTTDPQEHMEGPLSSLVKSTDENFKENGSSSGNDDDVSNS